MIIFLASISVFLFDSFVSILPAREKTFKMCWKVFVCVSERRRGRERGEKEREREERKKDGFKRERE